VTLGFAIVATRTTPRVKPPRTAREFYEHTERALLRLNPPRLGRFSLIGPVLDETYNEATAFCVVGAARAAAATSGALRTDAAMKAAALDESIDWYVDLGPGARKACSKAMAANDHFEGMPSGRYRHMLAWIRKQLGK
jgi:hypothetical protein